jgi:hypothetical protein
MFVQHTKKDNFYFSFKYETVIEKEDRIQYRRSYPQN